MDIIQNLILVAGPASSGKSTFFAKISAQALPQISETVGFVDPATWLKLELTSWKPSVNPLPSQVWADYTLTRPWLKRNQACYAGDISLQILNMQRILIVITVWVEPAILTKRFNRRQQGRVFTSLRKGNLKSALSAWEVWRRMQVLYKRPTDLLSQYKTWFAYCATRAPEAQWVLDNSATPVLYPLSDWLNSADQGLLKSP